jgi:hypothetical protein
MESAATAQRVEMKMGALKMMVMGRLGLVGRAFGLGWVTYWRREVEM